MTDIERPRDQANDERTMWWHFHRLSGVVIIFLLGFHVFFVMAEKGATIGSIQQRAAHLGYVAVDVMMLFIVLFHAFNGLRIILHGILDAWRVHYHPEGINEERLARWKKVVTVSLIIGGFILAIYGVAFIVMLSMQASS